MPSLTQVLRLLENQTDSLNEDVVDLVHWVVCSKSYPTLKSVARNDVSTLSHADAVGSLL